MKSDSKTLFVDDSSECDAPLGPVLGATGLVVEAYESLSALLASPSRECCGCVLLFGDQVATAASDQFDRLFAHDATQSVIVLLTTPAICRIFPRMRQGVFDMLPWPCESALLLERIQQSHASSQHIQELARRRRQFCERINRLTDREQDVLVCLLRGEANKQIAGRLKVSERTVEYRRARLLEKLDASSIPEICLQALAFDLPSTAGAPLTTGPRTRIDASHAPRDPLHSLFFEAVAELHSAQGHVPERAD